jgi:hypothetical protein
MTLRYLRPAILCLPLTCLGVLACEPKPDAEPDPNDVDAQQMCIDTYAPENGFGYQSDNEGDCPQPPEGDPVECPPVTPETVAQECADDGQTCDPQVFITRDAARCLAEIEELDDGLAEWRISLVYNYEYQRPIWVVDNTTQIEACGDISDEYGESLIFDAETGDLLDRGMWAAISC